ncbi:DUF5683 domain-containing protein [Adhaeribacter rhizoryzae]|uniref:DUF5683 domain-containing protein n=1 Tax=Adhaeribacter rhizoryzae TaxID=2607907 RepID=A0A5M6CYI0_9BACT|nr:DUF5683 domain-containing protein [Adhaeribacter rhizoryzae]KAA5540163.1 hypothetical protein F0145_23335 [Adhaeribacter rhizoryzae]
MKIFHQKLFLFLLISLPFICYQAEGQVITTGQDSAVVRLPDTTKTKAPKVPFYQISKWSEPGKAALFSAVIPGLGQAYNKSYWKIPIIYAGGAILGYFLHSNHKQYLSFRTAYIIRTDGDDTTIDKYANKYREASTLSRGRDQYRRWRDYTFLYSLLFYGINVSEAYVYAHLKDFDVSDELSMRVQPSVIPTLNNKVVPAFTLSLNLKK